MSKPPPPPPPGWRRAAADEGQQSPQWGDPEWGYEPDADVEPTSSPAEANRRVHRVGQVAARGGRGAAKVVGAGTRAGARRYQAFTGAHGADATGLSRLIQLHTVNVAGDAALTVSLAGTVFALPTDEARGQVALFLALTMAPFVILAPLIGPLLDRFRHGRRWAIGTTVASRAFLAWVLAGAIVADSAWLFPVALGALVASKAYAVTRAAAVPRLLPDGITLVKANSRLTIAGLLGMMAGGGIAGALSRIGPEWSLRAAFVIYVIATILAIRLPAAVDSDRGEGVFAGGDGSSPARRLRALPVNVRYVLWLLTGARMLSGFLTLFLAFLMREHPIPGLHGSLVLGLVAGAAAIGSALGSFVGNRKHNPPPPVLATILLCLALAAALTAAFLYSVWSLVALGLCTGLFGQLGKLSLDALIQQEVQDHLRGRVFAWSETLLQTFWVIGGGVGIAIPLKPQLGFGVVSALVVLAAAAALRSRATAAGTAALPGHATTERAL
ncbi:MFS transporter [Nostocoides veronense]|uniref:MFS transporter n=1 Tax=Nostocoides veronense TaxID=330836 RepID=A0ABN2LL64_9MICO